MKRVGNSKPVARTLSLRAGKRRPVRLRQANLADFCGIISKEEAAQMIRDIEEAFEKIDGE
jgi:hypothetical protein